MTRTGFFSQALQGMLPVGVVGGFDVSLRWLSKRAEAVNQTGRVQITFALQFSDWR